jgi:hypothetical protein
MTAIDLALKIVLDLICGSTQKMVPIKEERDRCERKEIQTMIGVLVFMKLEMPSKSFPKCSNKMGKSRTSGTDQ